MQAIVVKTITKGALYLLAGVFFTSLAITGAAAPEGMPLSEFLTVFSQWLTEQGLVLAGVVLLLVFAVPLRASFSPYEAPDDYGTNPASGLPMLNDGIDVGGNPFGTSANN